MTDETIPESHGRGCAEPNLQISGIRSEANTWDRWRHFWRSSRESGASAIMCSMCPAWLRGAECAAQVAETTLLHARDIELIPVDAPSYFTEPTPTLSWCDRSSRPCRSRERVRATRAEATVSS
jgi:hypothetical protein